MLDASVTNWRLEQYLNAVDLTKPKLIEFDQIGDPSLQEYNAKHEHSDVGRAAIVPAVSAFDHYFTARFAECVVPLVKKGQVGQDLCKFLSEAGLDVKSALELMTMQRPNRRIRKLVDDQLQRTVTQQFKAIDKLFKLISIPNLSDAVQDKTGRKTLNRSIQKLIDRRHLIAHRGDLNRHAKLWDLDPKEIAKRFADAKLFVDTAEQIIAVRMT